MLFINNFTHFQVSAGQTQNVHLSGDFKNSHVSVTSNQGVFFNNQQQQGNGGNNAMNGNNNGGNTNNGANGGVGGGGLGGGAPSSTNGPVSQGNVLEMRSTSGLVAVEI